MFHTAASADTSLESYLFSFTALHPTGMRGSGLFSKHVLPSLLCRHECFSSESNPRPTIHSGGRNSHIRPSSMSPRWTNLSCQTSYNLWRRLLHFSRTSPETPPYWLKTIVSKGRRRPNEGYRYSGGVQNRSQPRMHQTLELTGNEEGSLSTTPGHRGCLPPHRFGRGTPDIHRPGMR